MYSEYHDQKHSATTTPPAPLGVPIQTQPGTPLGLPIQTQLGTQERPWSSGLFGCFDDVSNCCITCWCPCITFGQVAEIIDEGSTSCGTSGGLYGVLAVVSPFSCCFSCIYRRKMRNKYMLNESPCSDWLVHCCCEPCALCQEYRELKNLGFDMSKGWKENLEKRQNSGMAMAPVVEGGMSR